MALLDKQLRIKATTIVESIVAMTVIAIAFGVGMMVVEMILNSNKAAFKYRVHQKLEQVMLQTKAAQTYLDEHIAEADFVIEKRVLLHENYSNLYRIILLAKDLEEREIMQQHTLIYLP